tara:strand:- start:1092 stop:2015 length:924 start_codon:yes stop_codon:yes gene_type:complete
MTALRYDKPTQSALRKAGMIFGLDLASLFDKEEGDDEAYSDFAPGVEFEKTTKGKGGGLYMRPQPVTGETTRLKFLPREAQIMSPSEISINLSAPPIQKPEEQEEEKKEEELLDRTLASFIGSGRGDAIGAQGIGRAQQYGYSDADIRAMAQQEGLKFGENAARSLGLNTELTSAKGGQGTTEGALGASALGRLRERGLADEAIISLARQQGLKFGEAAGQQLGVGQDLMYQAPKPAASSDGGSGLSQTAREIKQTFGSSNPQYSGGGGIGEAGIERMAKERGISFAQARDQARSAGLTIGARAAAR